MLGTKKNKLLSTPYPCSLLLHDAHQLCHGGGVGGFDPRPHPDHPRGVHPHPLLHRRPHPLGGGPGIQTWIGYVLKA